MQPLCIYHGNCDDGFAAAWCVRKGLKGNVEFFPGVYQKEPPPHEGRDVIFVDFSYKRPVLEAMASKARSVLILDHHKTAQEDLQGIDAPFGAGYDRYLDNVYQDICDGVSGKMYALFDMERSGAALAWDFFVGGDRPLFVEYVQDRDLWRKQLASGDEFTIALRSYPQDFETWDKLVENTTSLIEGGHSIQRYYRLRVEELKRSAYQATLDSQMIWIANAPYFAASEVAGELCVDHPEASFSACYFEVEKGRYQYSLRSRGDFDVSAVARKFGGGGHKAASGFSAEHLVHVS